MAKIATSALTRSGIAQRAAQAAKEAIDGLQSKSGDAEAKPPAPQTPPSPAPQVAQLVAVTPSQQGQPPQVHQQDVGLAAGGGIEPTPTSVSATEPTPFPKHPPNGPVKPTQQPAKWTATTPAPPAPTPPAPASAQPPAVVAKGMTISEPDYDIPENPDSLILRILTKPRSHDTPTERMFNQFVRGQLLGANLTVYDLPMEQFYVQVLDKDGKVNDVMFACHMDSVDTAKDILDKKLMYDTNFGHLFLANDSPGSCLGADDGAGVWMLLKMIGRKVPGTYVFHRGEECGGLGAKAIATGHKEWLKTFNLVVEFDRKGTSDIVTHQRGRTECASKKFSERLAEVMNDKGLSMKPTDSGVYTDCFEYRKFINEGINIAVGYESAHTHKEELNYAYLCALLEAVCLVDWSALPVDRDASKATDSYSYGGWRGRSRGYGGFHTDGLMDDDDDAFYGSSAMPSGGNHKNVGGKKGKKANKTSQVDMFSPDKDVLADLLLLTQAGIDSFAQFGTQESIAEALTLLTQSLRKANRRLLAIHELADL